MKSEIYGLFFFPPSCRGLSGKKGFFSRPQINCLVSEKKVHPLMTSQILFYMSLLSVSVPFCNLLSKITFLFYQEKDLPYDFRILGKKVELCSQSNFNLMMICFICLLSVFVPFCKLLSKLTFLFYQEKDLPERFSNIWQKSKVMLSK
jgi:hypothetical protein